MGRTGGGMEGRDSGGTVLHMHFGGEAPFRHSISEFFGTGGTWFKASVIIFAPRTRHASPQPVKCSPRPGFLRYIDEISLLSRQQSA